MKTKNLELFEAFNQDFARSNTDFIHKYVSDTIKWTVIGDFMLKRK